MRGPLHCSESGAPYISRIMNDHTAITLTPEDRAAIERYVDEKGPSLPVAYLFWFFIGILSAHRFYLNRKASAIVQILLILVVVGIVWWVIDAFLIPGMVASERAALRRHLTGAAIEARGRGRAFDPARAARNR